MGFGPANVYVRVRSNERNIKGVPNLSVNKYVVPTFYLCSDQR